MSSPKIITVFFLVFSLIGFSQSENPDRMNELIGNWTIDLRPSPDAEGYFQPMEIKSISDNTFEGTFYGSSVTDGYINTSWDRIYFAFSTSDGTHDYYHSGYMENGRLYGISYCPGRAFTAPWNGVKTIKQ